MWKLSGLPTPPLTGPLQPEKVLLYYDGPRSFTTTLGGDLYLAHWCDEDNEFARYLVVPIDEECLAALEAGTTTFRETLGKEGRLIVVDVAHADGRIAHACSTQWEDVPEEVKPTDDARLPRASATQPAR